MKFKKIVPYLIATLAVSGHTNNAASQVMSTSGVGNHNITLNVTKDLLALAEKVDVHFFDVYNVNHYLDSKAENLCNVYLDNMLEAQQKLAPYVGKRGYNAAVRQELPGAPVGLHCVYGQYTQLQRALDTMGDTLTIIPRDSNRACATFKTQMRRKYKSANGYQNCIFEGKMYESDSAYNAAMNAYLVRNHATNNDKMQQFAQRFEQNNFSIESIEPGSMLIVPRTYGNTQKFHMIVYVGRGRVENGQFIPDTNGRPVYTAHNRESIGYLFDAWDTRNVFAANIQQIARTGYAKELKRIELMPRQQLIEYILSGNQDATTAKELNTVPMNMLIKMARDKYFNNQIPKDPDKLHPAIAQNTTPSPFDMMMQRNLTHTI